jgi:hypothetical protein
VIPIEGFSEVMKTFFDFGEKIWNDI